eukprot:m.54067 g.54067  ORF g.54067 m.54067 type:complete len:268 (+) comp34309_c0_seq1:90-893(+)
MALLKQESLNSTASEVGPLEDGSSSARTSDLQNLQQKNQRLESELKFLKDMTKRMQDARLTAEREDCLQEKRDVQSSLPDKKSTSALLLASRKLRRYKSFETHSNPKHDKLAMELSAELKQEKQKFAEMKRANLALKEDILAKDQRIAKLEERLADNEKSLSLVAEENEQLRVKACKVEDLQETLKALQGKLMKENGQLSRHVGKDILKPSVSYVDENDKGLKMKLKERNLRLAVLESALKEKMQIISQLQSQTHKTATEKVQLTEL